MKENVGFNRLYLTWCFSYKGFSVYDLYYYANYVVFQEERHF